MNAAPRIFGNHPIVRELGGSAGEAIRTSLPGSALVRATSACLRASVSDVSRFKYEVFFN